MLANIIHISLIRKYILFSLSIIVPLGFLAKFYHGMAEIWFQNYAVGILYEMFWCLILFYIFPVKRYITPIVLGVFLITSLLEFSQLWHTPFLELIRSTFIGRTLIGTSFAWWDFAHYVIGCIMAYIWMSFLLKKAM